MSYNQHESATQDICDPSSCIHHLLPPPCDTSVLSRLRTVMPLSRLTSRTEKTLLLHYKRIKSLPKKYRTNLRFYPHYIVIFFFCIIHFCFNMLFYNYSVFIYLTVAGRKCEINLTVSNTTYQSILYHDRGS